MSAMSCQLNNLITLKYPRATFHSRTHNSRMSSLKSNCVSISLKTRRCSLITPVRAMASSSGLEDDVKNTVSQNPLVVYSKTWCPFCMQVKSLFKQLGVEAFVVELDEMGPQGEDLQNALARLTGQRTVPNVFIGNKHIGGCTDTLNLYGSGELESLLANARKSES